MDFINAAKVLELNIGKDKFLSLSEIEKQYRKLVKIYHPDLYVNDKKKYKWAHEKMKVINDAIEFIRNNYEDIKMQHEIKNAEEYEKAAAMKRDQKNEERKMREQEEAIRKEKFKYEEERARREEEQRKEEEKRKEEENRIKKEKLMEERRIKKEKRKEFIKKYKWIIILFILLAIGVLVYLYGNRSVTEYDKTSGIKEVGKYKNFKRDGLWTIYYEDGSYEERYYKDGSLDKEIIKYNSTGKSIQKVTIIDGKREGRCLEYDFDGNIISECFYKDDKLDGIYKRYSNNKVILEVNYQNGKREGKGVEYDLNGNLISEYFYKDDELDGIYKRYSNNKVILEENYKNGILDGKFTLFSSESKILMEGFYRDGKKEGEWIYSNLEKLYGKDSYIYSDLDEYKFLISLIESAHIFYYEDEEEKINIKGSFKNGLKEGEWTFYSFRDKEYEGFFVKTKVENKIINLYKNGEFVEFKYRSESWINNDGTEEKNESFIENNKIKNRKYYKGHLYSEGEDFFTNKSGKYTEFYESGKIFEIIDWHWEDEKEEIERSDQEVEVVTGKRRIFYENGKLFGEGEVKAYNFEDFHFRDNKNWKFYYENGALMLEGKYQLKWQMDGDGVRVENWEHIGEWTYYYKDGKNIKMKGFYNSDDNKIDNYWEFFDVDGNLEKRITIQGDKEYGIVMGRPNESIKYKISYYKDGYIENEEEFIHNMSDKKIIGYRDDLINTNILDSSDRSIGIADEKSIKKHLNIKE
ncbi:DnaJ domain-containing protein [Fusobacterium polymorphum]|uniref:DnaJ domain-containing protein n=1 Tax=Fusobacterium nucleatum subsp. polymorphum TaxID=76857 RepID=UPI003009A61E